MDRKRLLKTALGLLLAFTMAFAPLLSSYSVIAFAAGTDQEAAAGSAEVTWQGSEDPALADTAPAEGTAPADPAKGSGDTNADTPSREDPASDPASGGDQGEAETGDDPSEDEVVDNDLFVSVQPLRDDDEVAIDTAETGEKLTARFYAFNDNPNATAIAKIRVYADQITRKTDKTAVKHDDEDKVELKGAVGDKATTIVAEWKTLKADDPENDRGYAVDYLEFELPAGASVDCDIELSTVTGYDDEIKAEVYPEYKIADNNGDYPEEWSKPEDEEENKALLTWTGGFEWDNFIKTASDTVIGYNGSKFTADAITYSFSAENKKLNALTGIVYTESVTLEDTITLPDMLTLPEGAKSSYNKIVTANDDTIYEVNVKDYSYDFEVKVKDEKTIYYKVTIQNPDIDDPSKAADFSPVDKIESKLYLNDLVVSTDEQPTYGEENPVIIDNEANLKVESVEANDGDDKQTYKYEDKSNAEVKIIADGVVSMEKRIQVVRDTNGMSVSKVNGEWQVKRNYTVTYLIVIINNTHFDRTVNGFKDTIPKGLKLDKSSLTTTVGLEYFSAKPASSSKSFVGPDDGPLQIWINNYTIPAGTAGFINYTVTVEEKDYKPDTNIPTAELPLKNVAEYDGTIIEVPVRRMPEAKYTIKKAVVARYTRAINGNTCVIYADWDPRTEKYKKVEISGDSGSLYSSLNGKLPSYVANPSNDSDIVKALHEFDGGDVIVYNLYLLNEGDTDYIGYIEDINPFADSPNYARRWSAAGDKYKYQVQVNDRVYMRSDNYGGYIVPTWGPSISTLGGGSQFTDNDSNADFWQDCTRAR